MALITFADKQAMGTQPTIPEVNKITDSNMNEIKTAINNCTLYSSNEVVIGMLEKNGVQKPIYRKYIEGSATTSTNLSISDYINNYEAMYDMRVKYILSGETNQYFGNYYRDNVTQIIIIGGNNTQIVFRGTKNFDWFRLTLEYTKTTD